MSSKQNVGQKRDYVCDHKELADFCLAGIDRLRECQSVLDKECLSGTMTGVVATALVGIRELTDIVHIACMSVTATADLAPTASPGQLDCS